MASNAPKLLNQLGQSLWLDNITRDLLDSGTLKRYIDEFSVTGLTSNPTIFDNAITRNSWYDAEIRKQRDAGASGEGFFNLEGLPAIEEAIFAGVPVNVTLLFSTDRYRAAADAYMKGLERRREAGLSADVRSVASLFVSRSDVAVTGKVPAELRNALGTAFSRQAYKAYRDVLESDRFQRMENVGARAQRPLFASTGTKDKTASDMLYIAGLAAPNTVNTMPEETLLAFADHGAIATALARDSGDAEAVIAAQVKAGIDLTALAARLQSDGAKGFVKP